MLVDNKIRDIEYSFIFHFRCLFSESLYLKLMFRNRLGYKLNLDDPKTFSEKLQWLKLNYRHPIHTKMVDKYEAKKLVSGIIGEQHIIPTIGIWDTPEEIVWDSLPDRFVLKTTHGGGGCGVVVVNNKLKVDREEVVKKLNNSLKLDVYDKFIEWPYKNVKKRIIAEQYIEDTSCKNNDLRDYKFFCFNGEPKYCQVISGRKEKMAIDFFDLEWNHQPFHEPYFFPFSENAIEKPECYQEMIELAKELSKGFPFLRVDFYQVNGNVYFGELTFFPTSGMGGFSPDEWDRKFGDMITLPTYNEFNK